MLNIVSGASENHSKSLLQMINSVYNTIDLNFNFYIYDLGLSEDSLNKLKKYNKIILKKFDFNKYPSYFNIKGSHTDITSLSSSAGEYAWKPVIINEIAKEESGYLIWFDAGNILNDLNGFNRMLENLKTNKIISPISSGDILKWCHPKVIEIFDLQNNQDALKFLNRNGAIYGFNLNFSEVREFITLFSNLSCKKNYIAPDGSNSTNHRQDQTLFTILFYFFVKKNNIDMVDDYFNIKIHQDCD